MRPLYDHYRKVKRILSKVSGQNISTNNTSGVKLFIKFRQIRLKYFTILNYLQRYFTDSHNEDNDEDEVNYKDHKTFYNIHSFNL